MSTLETKVLAAVLPNSPARFETLTLSGIKASNFKDPHLKSLFIYIDSYYADHLCVIPEWALKERAVRKHSPEYALGLIELYRRLSKDDIAETDFREAIALIKDDELRMKTAEILVTAREMMAGTYYDEYTNTMLSGQKSTREFLQENLRNLEVVDTVAAPEGDVRDDVEKIWLDYENKEKNPDELGGIKYGIAEVDEFTGGVRAGELVLVAGYSGSGKSQIVTSLAWNALRNGHNVLMFTTETTREEMEIRVLARHSRLPKFKCPGGIDSSHIMNARLSPEHKQVFRNVLDDFKESDTGNLYMVQMPPDGMVDYVHAKAAQYNRLNPIDLIIIDSINLLRLPGKIEGKRIMLEDMLQNFKRFASSFDGGRGVAIVSPWQMSRNAWYEAKESGGTYTMASLSDTSEAEKSSSQIISIFKEDNDNTDGRLNIQVLKNRSGREMSKVSYPYDYRNSYIGDASDASQGSSAKSNNQQSINDIASFL